VYMGFIGRTSATGLKFEVGEGRHDHMIVVSLRLVFTFIS